MNIATKIILIDDDITDLKIIESLCKKYSYETKSFLSSSKALEYIDTCNLNTPFLIISDINMPSIGGFDLLTILKEKYNYSSIIFVSGSENIEHPIRAMRNGASDFLLKPINPDLFEVRVKNAIEKILNQYKYELMQDNLLSGRLIKNFVGKSNEIKSIYQTVMKVSKFDSTVLISGESGVGKERIAEAIHQGSLRLKKNFIVVNCASIPENLIESELFGYLKGSFTGADRDRIGLIEESNGGTLFLDEIGELPLHLQAKLLRVLQEKSVRAVGAKVAKKIDLRVVCATHKNLSEMVKKGLFREDLYYRLNVIPITIPPLRDRKEDLEVLIPFILNKINEKWEENKIIDSESFKVLLDYNWPGNVRELENVLERAFVLSTSKKLNFDTLCLENSVKTNTKQSKFSYSGDKWPSLKEIELDYISEIMSQIPTKEEAAKVLGIGRKTLYRKEEELRKYYRDIKNETLK